jgi:hypothetical protein
MEARNRQRQMVLARIQQQEQQARDPSGAEANEGSGGMVPATNDESTESAGREQTAAPEGSTATHGAKFWNNGHETERNSASAVSNRGKRVRIVTPEVSAATAASSSHHERFVDQSRPAFPAFYRVVRDAGAPVYNDGEAVSFVIRVIPFGVILLGCELAWRNCDGENRLMVRMPDGWVIDEDVERVVAVQF